ncbi:MAG: AtpZ/AtpI family protein [Myxococcota bacterium]
MTGQPNDDQQTERQRTARRQGLAYQGAFEAVIAILIAAGIGLWADGRFDTSPRYLIIGTIVGFGSFVLRLLRLGRQLQEAAEPGDPDESSS